jgi:hypothetical protein
MSNGDYSSMDWGYGGGDYSDWGGYSGYGGDTSGGNWFSNLSGGVGNTLSKPNTWNAILGLGQLAGSAFGGGNKKPTFNYSPAQGKAYQGMQGLAQTGLYNQKTIDDMMRMAQASNVGGGFAPNATSGKFRNTLGELMLSKAAQDAQFKSGVFGQMGGIAGQGLAQQQSNPWYQDVFSTLQNQANNAMLMKLLGGQNSGGLASSPFMASLFNL